MRKLLSLLSLFLFLSCGEKRSHSGELTNYLPYDASLILKLENPDLFFSNLGNNEFLQENSSHPFIRTFEDKANRIKYFAPKKRSYLSFIEEAKDSVSFIFITRGTPEVLQKDSLKLSKEREITRRSLGQGIVFTSLIDSVFILSDSRSRIENLVFPQNRKELSDSPDFQKALRAASGDQPVIFINHKRSSPFLQHFFPQFLFPASVEISNWTSLDLEISQGRIKMNGITTAEDTLPRFINLFRKVKPARNELAEITPPTSRGFFSFTFRDFSRLQENLDSFKNSSTPGISREYELLQTAKEAGFILLQNNRVFAVKHLGSSAQDAFISDTDLVEDFRGISIYNYSSSEEFKQLLAPIANPENLNFVAPLDNFLIFSEDIEALREIIRNLQNERSLATTEAYASSFKSLSSEASLLWVNNNTGESAQASRTESSGTPFNLKEFPLTALQFIYNGSFAHVHAIIEKNEASPTAGGVNQSVAVSLDAPLANRPAFFKNHRTKGMDIAVQDINNNLYLISPQGDIYWKKQLDSRILGSVQQVDILKNGRYQLSFATQNALHIIDRGGNPYKPFPLNFRDEITQPLAIFDYDNNRNYRFLIVQQEEVFMYNNQGKSVNGFKFSKASERITNSPKHIRLGRKDYILIPETSGRLNILSRTGETRVPVKEQIVFSDNEWYEYEGRFISTNELGQLVKIDENGTINREDLGLSENHKIDATPKTLVTLSENELTIKGKKVTLDFGMYTPPQIFYLHNKVYVSITDTQAKRVFLFDSNAELMPGFPVYGNSMIDFADTDNDRKPELVVQGEDDSLLLYEL